MQTSEAEKIEAWWRPDGAGPALRDLTLGALLDEQAAAYGDRPALLIDEGAGARETAWTYRELKEEADEIARGLIGIGVAFGDRVAVMAQNCTEWALLEFALAKIGAVLVTVNPSLLLAELGYLLEQGKVNAIVFAPTFRKNDIAAHLKTLLPDADEIDDGIRGAAEVLPDLRLLLAIGPVPPKFAMPFDKLREFAANVSPDELTAHQGRVQSSDVAQIQYTSGTTGNPKGAMLTHHSTVNNARLMAWRGGYSEADTMLSAMPLFHTAGCVCNVMAMVACGGRLVTMDAFEPGRMLALWDAHAPTLLNAVPTMMTRMLEHPAYPGANTRTLRRVISGGTAIPPSLMQRMRDETGGEPLIIMGMTECSPIITQTRAEDDLDTRLRTAGTPLPHTEIRIVDPDTGETCAWGESGELCIRGYLTMAGYFEMPDKTAETIDADGWLHSGDLATLAPTGHLRIVGRLKDMIIRGGENVYPVEIENCLLAHADVSQAQVVSVPDDALGEEIFAFVVAAPGAVVDPAELQSHCRDQMARHKMPKYIHPVADLPLTANGKVQKFALREQAAALITSGETTPVRQ